MAGVTREDLRKVVDSFYAEVRQDERLGPVFASAVGDGWGPHLERMTEFWSTVALGTRTFKGNVYQKHVELSEQHDVVPEHFLRWITLWHKHTAALLPAPAAEELQATAAGIGRNLFYGFFQQFAHFVMQDGVAVDYVSV
ncbi:MAG: group III truncated hemoglobin [Burkholderiales bacterium]|nr:MAG: group III truncated hemoglobin [Burkholderiales bacterium]